MTKKQSFEKYEEIGELFKQANKLVCKLTTKASRFGKVKYSNPLSKALKIISRIRSDLEERFCKEYPEEFTTHVFYGELKQKEVI